MNNDPTIIKICDLLKQQNKNQKELTDFLGISQNAFTDWKSGRIKSYNKHLGKIAEFLNVSVDYLVNPATKSHQAFISYQSKKDKALIDTMSDSLKAITVEQLTATPMEQTLLEAFRASTDAGRMQILEAALKAKMANEGSDVAQKKES